jgi:hypothetical protein
MSRLRVYKANGGKVIDLLKLKKERQERKIRQEIRDKVDKEIMIKSKTYTDVWNHDTITSKIGKRTGIYHYMKMVRGI